MGFRSTFTTQHYNIIWPDWFVDKYKHYVYFGHNDGVPLCSKVEIDIKNEPFNDLLKDIQLSINWEKFLDCFVLVYLHECGGITRCEIGKDYITISEPEKWECVDGITHDYCYGCSDVSHNGE